MKILVVCSGNYAEPELNFPIFQAFIHDQIRALSSFNVSFDKFFIIGKGIIGYLKNVKKLRKKINSENFDLVHAHVGFTGFISILSSPIPVVITYHGSDINFKIENIISSISALFLDWGIYVSNNLYCKAFIKAKRFTIIPCGVDFEVFHPEDMNDIRLIEGLDSQKKYVLFPSYFENPVKNRALAENAINILNEDIVLLELKNKSRAEVSRIINSVDVLLLTSFSEGSPQVIKEAMACNCPIVATNVGDIKEVIGETEGCYITSFDCHDVAEKLKMALTFGKRTNGREKIKRFDNKIVASTIYNVYKEVLALQNDRNS